MDMETNPQDHGLVSRIGPVEVDWPRSIGYFGGVTLATALGIIEPPYRWAVEAGPPLNRCHSKQCQPYQVQLHVGPLF